MAHVLGRHNIVESREVMKGPTNPGMHTMSAFPTEPSLQENCHNCRDYDQR